LLTEKVTQCLLAHGSCLFKKRRNGFYYILIAQDGHRRWRSTGAKLKSEALQAFGDFQEHHEFQADTPKPTLLSEFTREYLAYLRRSIKWGS
jgi:hypothetical protein